MSEDKLNNPEREQYPTRFKKITLRVCKETGEFHVGGNVCYPAHDGVDCGCTRNLFDELFISKSAHASAVKKSVEKERHEFQNFHRNLCERFGYPHDPVDWKRDQLSLEEHIASFVREKVKVALGVLFFELDGYEDAEDNPSWGRGMQYARSIIRALSRRIDGGSESVEKGYG